MYISTTLPYDIETLVHFIAGFHQSIWPLQLLFLFMIGVALWVLKFPSDKTTRLIGPILCVFWLFCGYGFYIDSFSQISFLAPYIGSVFIVQGFIILQGFTLRKNLALAVKEINQNRTGIVCISFALVLYPAFIFFLSSSSVAIPVVGITPLATSLFTLGVISFFQFTKGRMLLLVTIPILHVILSIVFGYFLLS